MVNEGVSVKYLEGEDIKISFDYIGIARHSDRHQIEFLTTVLIRLCRHLTGRRLVPIRARFTHHRDSEFSEFAAFYGGDVEFGATMDEVAFAMTTKHLPLVSADPYLNELLIASCEVIRSRSVAIAWYHSFTINAARDCRADCKSASEACWPALADAT